jgi:hypothetical protein
MRTVEQKLVAVLTETPRNTECAVSVSVLNGLGYIGEELQAVWLKSHRPAAGDWRWQLVGERWQYARTST